MSELVLNKHLFPVFKDSTLSSYDKNKLCVFILLICNYLQRQSLFKPRKALNMEDGVSPLSNINESKGKNENETDNFFPSNHYSRFSTALTNDWQDVLDDPEKPIAVTHDKTIYAYMYLYIILFEKASELVPYLETFALQNQELKEKMESISKELKDSKSAHGSSIVTLYNKMLKKFLDTEDDHKKEVLFVLY
ncbi:hypothetical protein RFI_11977 [Reticulomyxa filosa]|uniref:Uncharacterized protein n=1 Tax=Reticulomyxa filosa TaxID=46433 RepID=X6NFR6_RETFI|nr:hypothetical protein RFI_11977 [Reticulomyxa filosa]|eukprot:ETO25165.1 hypothetical protein RFI_11977 [Reticulomyxa filosa]